MLTSASIDKLIDTLKEEKNPIAAGKVLYRLTKKEGVQLKKIARILNKKESALSHLIRLNKLPEAIIDGYLSKVISLSHLYVISRLDDQELMMEVYEKVLSQNLNVIQTEILVRQKKYQILTQGKYFDSQKLDTLKKTLKKHNIEFEVIQSQVKTKIILVFKGNLEKGGKFLNKFFQSLKNSFEVEENGDY